MSAINNLELSDSQIKALRNHLTNFEKSLCQTEKDLLKAVSPFTMLPPSRIVDAYHSARQAAFRYPTATIAEFGVFAGGGLISLAYGAASNTEFSGSIVGFDTFEGHVTRPSEDELDLHGRQQAKVYDEIVMAGHSWAACSLDQNLRNFEKAERLLNIKLCREFVKGDVCHTARSISQFGTSISLVRLDMDWYAPTIAALEAVFPFLEENAIIIVDDYGHHTGVKQAVDSFFNKLDRRYDYAMIDYSCRRIQLLD